MSTFFQETESFSKRFDLSERSPYFGYQPLSGDRVGFIVRRFYPNLFRFQPSRTESGEPDTVALLRVAYTRPEDAEEEIDPDRVPLEIDVVIAPLAGEAVEPGVPQDPLKPAPLELDREYSFSHGRDTFVDSRGGALTGSQLLERVYQAHCDTTRSGGSFGPRFRLRLRGAVARLLACSARVILFVLQVLLGREIIKTKGALIPEFRVREKAGL
jgi:hypothetical protein